MTTNNIRPFWIAWCCAWAVGWFFVGLFTFLVGWVFVPMSLLAILIPVGAPRCPRRPTPVPWWAVEGSRSGWAPPRTWEPGRAPFEAGRNPRWWG
jgi:hypothetical protein